MVIINNQSKKKFNTYRWLVWWILILAYLIVFFHRMALGVVRENLTDTFHITSATFGYLGSTYFYAYLFMQIPSGILADTLGARKTVTIGTFLAALGSILFGIGPTIHYVFLGRLMVGLGVSVVLISILKVLSQWFEEERFATMSGMTTFMGNLGGALAQTPLALAVGYFTWRTTFIGIGIISMFIAFLCYAVVRNTPDDKGFSAVYSYSKHPPIRTASLKESLVEILLNPYTWPPFFVFAGVFGSYLTLTGTWGQSYLINLYGFSPSEAPNYLVVMVVAHAIGCMAAGKISDGLKRRKLPMMVFCSINAISWGVFLFINQGKPPIGLLYPLYFMMGFSSAGVVLGWACAKELNHPSSTGLSTSIVNMGGFFGAALLPPMLGRVLDKYGTTLQTNLLYQRAFLYCFIAVIIGTLSTFFIKETYCKNQHHP
ncbi:MFS transporter [Natronincola ferrireducens]|uniref:Sugar phosphate permease n=1 Tax=Natronincola ferrireducens TaxID=393762 RepID=A0A1G8Y3N5_9FIRM|nr:MFS transporter [Natronincola ferrireducens]SDJ97432.1 Sugar phosphate permease [Natronincola ferrireducens]